MKKILTGIFLILSSISFSSLFAQTQPVKFEGLKMKLNEDGSHYFQATFLNQTWVRFNESNPGTTVLGEKAPSTIDIGLRRTRIQMFGQVSDRAFLYFQFGMNNYNRMTGVGGNRKLAAFFHDAVGEYRISKGNELKVGGGLTIANGLSRFSQPSIGSILTLDVPVFAQATVDQTDLFARKLSVYLRGQISKIDYRVSLSDPFPVNSTGASLPAINSNSATFAQKGHRLQQQAYLMYQFWDKEGHTTPYMTGSYLGKKKVFNIGGGIIYQPKAMWIKDGNYADSIKYQNMLLWSFEGFLDTPLNKEKGTALSAYLGYFNYNYGKNYVRTQAQMNPADANSTNPGVNIYSKGGNGWPMFGTGNIIYGQIGCLLPQNLLKTGILQPYFSFQRNDLKALSHPFFVFDVGINWLINGHNSKFSLDYQNRPVFYSKEFKTRRSGLVLQYQILI